MNMLMFGGHGPITMSSREIAELCEKRHPDVRRDIRAMLDEIGVGVSKFAHTYHDVQGKAQEEYHLPKDLTVTLITGYRADLRYKVVKRLEELEGQPHIPDLSDPAVLVQLLTEHASKRIEAEQRAVAAEARADTMQEDVAILDRLTKADGCLNLTESAKALGIQRKMLVQWLLTNTWCYRRAGSKNMLGYQKRTASGDLVHKVTTILTPNGDEKITEQVLITAQGLSKLAKLMPDQVGAANGTE